MIIKQNASKDGVMYRYIRNMRRIVLTLLMCTSAIVLCSCCVWIRLLGVPQKVIIDGVSYETGFYGDMCPKELKKEDDAVTVGGIEYRRVVNEKYRWVHNDQGEYTTGVIYCDSSQWQDAYNYYHDPANFTYYCSRDYFENEVVVENADPEKFEALEAFEKENSYEPFDSEHNNRIERLHLPEPDFDKYPPIRFYRQSNDRCFSISRGDRFHIIDNQMYLVFYYTLGEDGKREMQCTKVPDELADYFLGIVEKYSMIPSDER